MIYSLFTDPHLGTRRAAHTTRDSAKRLADALYDQALLLTRRENPACLGDLYDHSFNSEEVLVQGHSVAADCRWTLAGNHDSSNRAGTLTSLDALKELDCSIISAPDLSAPYFSVDGACYLVPHHASQALFEQAMFQAAEHASTHREGRAATLMLHCNYDFGFACEDDTLNLSAEVAEKLLVAFDLILLGHEHKPASHFDGRVVILGNTHPTSYADLSDKYVYTLDSETAELSRECIWSMAERYREIKVGAELPDLTGVQFVDVIGMAEADGALGVADFVQSVWRSSDSLLAVRNNVKIGDHLADLSADDAKPALVDLKAKIAEDLQGSDMLALYQMLLQEVEA